MIFKKFHSELENALKQGEGREGEGVDFFLESPLVQNPNSALLSHVILTQTKHIYSRKINRVTFTKEDKRAVSDVENLNNKKNQNQFFLFFFQLKHS